MQKRSGFDVRRDPARHCDHQKESCKKKENMYREKKMKTPPFLISCPLTFDLDGALKTWHICTFGSLVPPIALNAKTFLSFVSEWKNVIVFISVRIAALPSPLKRKKVGMTTKSKGLLQTCYNANGIHANGTTARKALAGVDRTCRKLRRSLITEHFRILFVLFKRVTKVRLLTHTLTGMKTMDPL